MSDAEQQLITNIQNQFLRTYLECVEDTESPRIFHIWSAVSMVSAAIGRKAWFPWGDDGMFPNMYVCLVGQPATRKNVALNISRKFLEKNCIVRFAPDDTSGQRQGLLRSLIGQQEEEDEDDALDVANAATFVDKVLEVPLNIDEDKNTIYAVATELSAFMGQKSESLLTFLIKMYDGEDYEYTLKNEKDVLKNGLLNILGATTSTSLSSTLPPEAIGGGFMSRIIFVYAAKKYKDLPRRKPLKDPFKFEIDSQLHQIQINISGEFTEEAEAAAFLDSLYYQKPDLQDHRFIYYVERRHTHLIKLTTVLAAMRNSMIIKKQDVQDALLILAYTETGMPSALGEFGLSKTSLAVQRMMEFLQQQDEPINVSVLWALMQKDLTQVDFYNALQDLKNAQKIVETTVDKKTYVAAVEVKVEEDKWSELLDVLTGETE